MTQSRNATVVVGIVAFAFYLLGATLILIQRSHDMNLSGWWSIAAMIPLVGLVWMFKGGTPGANRWARRRRRTAGACASWPWRSRP